MRIRTHGDQKVARDLEKNIADEEYKKHYGVLGRGKVEVTLETACLVSSV